MVVAHLALSGLTASANTIRKNSAMLVETLLPSRGTSRGDITVEKAGYGSEV